MKTNAKKSVYTLSSVIMAVLVFLLALFFTGSKITSGAPAFDNTSSEMSSSQQEQDNSGAGLGGGGNQDNSGGGSGSESTPEVLFTVLADKTQTMYLRQDSKGDYTGTGEHGFVGDTKYYLENPTDENPLYYWGLTMKNSGLEKYQAEIELKELTNDLLPYAATSKTGDTNEKVYTVTYYPYDYLANGLTALSPMGDMGKYSVQEQRYYDFVKSTYLAIPASLKQTLLRLARENDIRASSDTVVYDVVEYIKNAAYYDREYANKDYPVQKDMVTYFLTQHKRGVCRHFAAAATMMFRALGIPARYTIGFAVDVEADVLLEYTGPGHAWTEIYVQGYGWVPLEVTGGNMYVGEQTA